jgi:hypothetical protein
MYVDECVYEEKKKRRGGYIILEQHDSVCAWTTNMF